LTDRPFAAAKKNRSSCNSVRSSSSLFVQKESWLEESAFKCVRFSHTLTGKKESPNALSLRLPLFVSLFLPTVPRMVRSNTARLASPPTDLHGTNPVVCLLGGLWAYASINHCFLPSFLPSFHPACMSGRDSRENPDSIHPSIHGCMCSFD